MKRRISAIFSADVKGYSRLMGEDEVATVRTLKEYLDLMSRLIKEHGGRVVDSPGDNILAEFGSVVNALECSLEIQGLLKNNPTAPQMMAAMMAHINEHIGFQYRNDIQEQLGMSLPPQKDESGEQMEMNPEVEARLAPMLAQAAAQLLMKNHLSRRQRQPLHHDRAEPAEIVECCVLLSVAERPRGRDPRIPEPHVPYGH